jgi:hypothetical protein
MISPGNRAQIQTYLRHDLPFFVEGGPGIGKSLAVEHLGRLVYRERCGCAQGAECRGLCLPLKIDMTEDTEVRHLLGELDLIAYFAYSRAEAGSRRRLTDHFRPGPLVQAMRQGRLLIVEELDRAGRDTLFPIFFDAIEYRTTYVPDLGTPVVAGQGFNIVFTVNRFTDIGTVALPKALLRRQRCVRFYDPSHELDGNRWHAAQYETAIVMQSVAPIAAAADLSPARVRAMVLDLLARVVFPLRTEGVMSDPPTPAETTMWFRDMVVCDGARLVDEATSRSEKLAIALGHRGALIKAPVDEPVFIAALTKFFTHGDADDGFSD